MDARALLLAALVLGGCVSPSPEVLAATERGRRDAEYDVAHRRPRRAFIGFLDDRDSALDPATGLVRFSAGCCKSGERIAYCSAYNDVVDAARGSGALAGVTLEKKARTRRDIDALFGAPGATSLRLGDAGVLSPGGRWHVGVASAASRDSVAVWSTDVASGDRTELRWLGTDTARVVFADDGSTLVVHDARARLYVTFDLPTALPLQVFAEVTK